MSWNGFTHPKDPVWRLVNTFVGFEVLLLKLATGVLVLFATFVILNALVSSLKRTSKRDGGALPEVQDVTSTPPAEQKSLAKAEDVKSQEIEVSLPKSEIESANKELEKNQERKTYLPKSVELSPEELKQKAIKELLGGF